MIFCYNCIVPLGFLPCKNRVAFPGESQLWQSNATQSTELWRASVILLQAEPQFKVSSAYRMIFYGVQSLHRIWLRENSRAKPSRRRSPIHVVTTLHCAQLRSLRASALVVRYRLIVTIKGNKPVILTLMLNHHCRYNSKRACNISSNAKSS